jgi:hypothetical protein
MPADLRELAVILRAVSPNLRIVVSGFASKNAVPDLSGFIRYVDDIECPDDRYRYMVLLKPDDWAPEWGFTTNGDAILWGPELSLRLAPCFIARRPWETMAGPAPPGCAPDYYLLLIEGRLEGFYYPWEENKKRFLYRVRRIFDKYAANRFCRVDPERLKPRFVSLKGDMDRIGPYAAAWAMAHPRHFLGYDFTKPVEWAEKYPEGWRPD